MARQAVGVAGLAVGSSVLAYYFGGSMVDAGVHHFLSATAGGQPPEEVAVSARRDHEFLKQEFYDEVQCVFRSDCI